MAAITASGLGSGIDVDLLVQTLTEAERTPVKNRLDLREIQVQADVSAFKSLKQSLSSFQSALSGLTRLSDFAGRSAKSSDESVFSVSANNSAVPSNTEIEVKQLAQAHKLVSMDFADPESQLGAGTLTIGVGAESFSVDIDAGQNNSLYGIRDSINEAPDNKGVTASILKVDDPLNPGSTVHKLVLTSKETGADNNITVTVTNDADGDNDDAATGLSRFAYVPDPDPLLTVENLTELDDPLDAIIEVDGFEVTSSTNVFSNVIQGVTIDALSADPGVKHTLTVASDVAGVKDKITGLVEAFNTFDETYKFLTAVDGETQEAGLLTGDSTARSLEGQLRRTLSTVVGDTDNDLYTSLSRIGITTGEEGVLELDEAALSAALSDDFDQVAELIAGDEGVAKRMDDLMDTFLQSGGVISSREATFKVQLEDIAQQREDLELRLESVESRLRKQFTAMDIIVAQFKSTGDFITQQFDAMKPVKN